jgi:signal transduction histidine kinase
MPSSTGSAVVRWTRGWPARLRTVRARTTVVATAAMAVVLLVAFASLIFAVRQSAVRAVQAQAEAEVDAVVDRLRAGLSPEEALAQTSDPDLVGGNVFTYLAILDAEGNPVVGNGFFEIAGVAEDGGGVTVGGFAGVDSVQVVGSSDLAIAHRSVEIDGRALLVVAASPLAEAVRGIDRIIWASLLGGPLVIALVGLVTWTATGQTLRPIERIRSEVDALSSQTLDRRVPVPPTGDEVALLAETMNRMLARLETASARQREFISDASHELRSPVAAIRTELEVTLAHPGTSDWHTIASGVLDETGRIERLVDDLLLLTRLDEGATLGATGPVDLGVIAHETVAAATAGTNANGVTIDIDVDAASRLLVRGRSDELASVARNLVDNAARYAVSAVHVTVASNAPDSVVALMVDDDGQGIPPADRERVFDRFTRLEPARSRRNGGVGLGLAVVKRVVGRHGGSVTVLDSPTGGTRLEVLLPAMPAD